MSLGAEFSEKKVQKLIRSGLEFESFKVDKELLDEFESLKENFFKNVSSLSKVGKDQLMRRFKNWLYVSFLFY